LKFLLPVGGITDHRFGILTSPAHWSAGFPQGIRDGMAWAADNDSFKRGFKAEKYFPWLEKMRLYQSTCLFVAVPDKVGDAETTLSLWDKWFPVFDPRMWPLAFVAQDGQESMEFPPAWQWRTLFIGGTTHWKTSDGAVRCIKRAQEMGKAIHIGRVNWVDRYRFFRALEGSEEFTCDGTRTRYEGTERTIAAWSKLMDAPKPVVETWPIRLPLLDSDRPS
jgi:hypothetical protein